MHNSILSGLVVWLLLVSSFPPCPLAGQSGRPSGVIVVDSILVEGNRRTRTSLILRELDFSAGDTLAQEGLAERIENNRLRVMNLGLFTAADVSLVRLPDTGEQLAVIQVKEGWYTYPAPVFELVDRNFNVWWNEFDRSFKRVNYGVNWFQLNLTGRRDILRLNLNFGYANRYEIVYTNPAINKNQTLGLQFGLNYSRAKEVAYATRDNKLQFLADQNGWQLQQVHANLGFSWRPAFFTSQTLVAEFRRNSVSDLVSGELNPDFFLNRQPNQQHFSLSYSIHSDHRDIRPYPLKGWFGRLELRRNGLLPSDNLQNWRLRGEWRQYAPLNRLVSLEQISVVRTTLPRTAPPYFNNQALGYGNDYVRGYEYFVADGLDYLLSKSSVHIQLLNRNYHLGKMIPLEAYQTLPVKIYLSLNNDLGFANDPYYAAGNPLSNRLLWGAGLGLDFVLYYDKVFRVEYTRNDLGAFGLFLNFETGI